MGMVGYSLGAGGGVRKGVVGVPLSKCKFQFSKILRKVNFKQKRLWHDFGNVLIKNGHFEPKFSNCRHFESNSFHDGVRVVGQRQVRGSKVVKYAYFTPNSHPMCHVYYPILL